MITCHIRSHGGMCICGRKGCTAGDVIEKWLFRANHIYCEKPDEWP